MTAGVDLALAIVEKGFGLETARMVARKLVVHSSLECFACVGGSTCETAPVYSASSQRP
ncbi:hypothetical protein BH10PSE17_BH10PSE17_03500 [soil metagenome]